LLGEKNAGWRVAMAVMDFERSLLTMEVGIARRLFNFLIQYVKEQENREPSFLATNSRWRTELANIATKIDIARLLIYRVVWQQTKGIESTYEPSISKIFISSLIQGAANIGMQLLGTYGQLSEGSKLAPLGGVINRLYLDSLGHSIAAGTDEIQKNIIATRGLGLPRS
jgi:alkylation response protein AidB-like acyl-CoA dehydrogenase